MSPISVRSIRSSRKRSSASRTRNCFKSARRKEGRSGGISSDPEEDPPDEHKRAHSYHLFFVSPEDAAFRFETEAEGIAEPEFMTEEFDEAGWGEDPVMCPIAGSGRTGWVVAVSLVAPFGVIELSDVISYEDGSTTEAVIESHAETEGGKQIDAEEHFRKARDAHAYQTLVKLRAKISAKLEKRGITVLPAEEWREARARVARRRRHDPRN